jgi:hypothetical protein
MTQKMTGLGFSIPSGATIDGVQVDIERHKIYGETGNVHDDVVRLVKGFRSARPKFWI